MSEENDPYTKIIDSFYASGYQRIENIEGTITENKLNDCIENQQKEIDQFNELFLEQAVNSGTPADCENGCEFCCHQEVFALNIEMNRILKEINANYSDLEKKEILTKARIKLEKSQDTEQKQWEKIRIPCPLLKDGSCRVYAIRPMACRIYLSYSRESCIAHNMLPNENEFPALFKLPLRCGQMCNEGLAQALRKQDLKINESSIEQALVDGILGN